MFKSKIHRATVTEADLNYKGSITIDRTLIEAANILPYERVQVININNGARAETYVIEGEANSGIICLNGGIARLAHPGDLVIIASYALMTEEESVALQPIVINVDAQNKIVG
jgi:aspartate 1-decarboxylase